MLKFSMHQILVTRKILTVNIWKSYMGTEVEETKIEEILADMNTTELVVKFIKLLDQLFFFSFFFFNNESSCFCYVDGY